MFSVSDHCFANTAVWACTLRTRRLSRARNAPWARKRSSSRALPRASTARLASSRARLARPRVRPARRVTIPRPRDNNRAPLAILVRSVDRLLSAADSRSLCRQVLQHHAADQLLHLRSWQVRCQIGQSRRDHLLTLRCHFVHRRLWRWCLPQMSTGVRVRVIVRVLMLIGSRYSTFGTSQGQTACTSCGAGTYSSTTGLLQCTSCAAVCHRAISDSLNSPFAY